MQPQHLAALAAPLAFLASPAATQQPELVPVGATAQGALSLHLSTQHNHHGHGYQRVAAALQLHEPRPEAGRSVTRYELTQDWDCARRQMRTVRLVRRDWTGEYAGGDYKDEPWRPVPKAGGEARAWEIICPAEAAALSRLIAAPAAAPQPPRRRGPAEVIVMPKGSTP